MKDQENKNTATESILKPATPEQVQAKNKELREAEKAKRAELKKKKAEEKKKAAAEAKKAAEAKAKEKPVRANTEELFGKKWGEGQLKLCKSFMHKDAEMVYRNHYARGSKGIYLGPKKTPGTIIVSVLEKVGGEEVTKLAKSKKLDYAFDEKGKCFNFKLTAESDKDAVKELQKLTRKLSTPKAK